MRSRMHGGATLRWISLGILTLSACSSGSGEGKKTHSVSGMVSGAIADGVSVTLNGAGGTRTATTSAGGSFAFADVANGSYTLTPLRDGYAFTPPSISVTVSDSDVNNNNFTAVSVLHSISGSISGDVGDGVTVALGGAFTGTTTTSGGGHFNFPNLQDGVYTVTPSAAGFRFLPESRTVTLSGADATGIVFASGEASKSIYTLTVSKDGSGSGTVTAVGGLDCGSTCSMSVFSGASVTVTAAAASNSSFSGWSGCDSASGSNCTVTLTADRMVTASFTVLRMTVLAGVPSTAGHVDATGAEARFSGLQGVGVDAAGNIYVADTANNAIRRVTPAGVVSTFAASGSVHSPTGVAVDPVGNVYVADFGSATIRKVTPSGEVSTLAGKPGNPGSDDGSGENARFRGPQGVAVDAAGNVYVADTGNHTIRKVTSAGVTSTLAGSAGNAGSDDGNGPNARFTFPTGVAVDSAGNVYVADQGTAAAGFTGGRTIRKVTPGGVVSTFAGSPGNLGSNDGSGSSARFYFPSAVALDAAGNVYVADLGNQNIRKVTPAGTVSTLAGSANEFPGSEDGSGSVARFRFPSGVAVDASGNVYVADSGNNTLRKVTPDGVVSTLAGVGNSFGSEDGTGPNARFSNGLGAVAIAGVDGVYVADSGNSTLRKVTSAGVVTTVAGSGGGFADGTGTGARFSSAPNRIAVDADGNVYVADTGNHTIRKVTSAGVVTTLAGSAGNAGSADGTGPNARFGFPQGVAVDAGGNVYVADTENHTLRKVTPAGVVSTLAGSPGVRGSTDGAVDVARFDTPSGVAVDATGNLYVADSGDHRLRKVTPAGVVSTLAGSFVGSNDGIGTNASFQSPTGIAVDAAGNVYVADTGNSTLRKVTPAGVVSTIAGLAGNPGSVDGTGPNARFTYPQGIAVDAAGNVYVADTYNSTLRKVTPAGVVSTIAGLAGNPGSTDGTGSAARFFIPQGVAVDGAGNVYIADAINSTLRKLTPAGVVSTVAGVAGQPGSADGTGSGARFLSPQGIAVDGAGNVYVADFGNQAIRKVTPAGVASTVAGSPGNLGNVDGTGPNARFTYPQGIAVDAAGNVYVADTENFTIRKVTPAGVVSTLAGRAGAAGSSDGSGSSARFSWPEGLAVDAAGNIYVADRFNHTIRKVTPAGVVTTLAGSAGKSGSTDGTGSAAGFFNPQGVAVDVAGNVWVADTGNNAIRRVTPAGVVTTPIGVRGPLVGNFPGPLPASLAFPTGVSVDAAGSIYITVSGAVLVVRAE